MRLSAPKEDIAVLSSGFSRQDGCTLPVNRLGSWPRGSLKSWGHRSPPIFSNYLPVIAERFCLLIVYILVYMRRDFTCTPHRLHFSVSFLVYIEEDRDLPSSKGLAPNFEIRAVTAVTFRGDHVIKKREGTSVIMLSTYHLHLAESWLPNMGGTFWIRLPTVPQAVPQSPSRPQPNSAVMRTTVFFFFHSTRQTIVSLCYNR